MLNFDADRFLRIEQGAVDHLAARDARSLARMLLEASTLEEARVLVESAQANLATHPEEHPGGDDADHARGPCAARAASSG